MVDSLYPGPKMTVLIYVKQDARELLGSDTNFAAVLGLLGSDTNFAAVRSTAPRRASRRLSEFGL